MSSISIVISRLRVWLQTWRWRESDVSALDYLAECYEQGGARHA
jgi:hypothetical protein